MTGDSHRQISIERQALGRFLATNPRGATLEFGNGEGRFSPVELLLTALAGCSGMDVDALTSRLAEPTSFTVDASGEKVRDEGGNHLVDLQMTFRVTFPAGDAGDTARTRLPDAIAKSHDRLCTVTRTVEMGTPVAVHRMD